MSLVLKWQRYRELRALRKLYSRDLLYSEHSSGSKYSRVLNMSRLLKILKKMHHYRYLIVS